MRFLHTDAVDTDLGVFRRAPPDVEVHGPGGAHHSPKLSQTARRRVGRILAQRRASRVSVPRRPAFRGGPLQPTTP